MKKIKNVKIANVNLIGFQSDMHKNQIWTDSLNEAMVSTQSVSEYMTEQIR